MTCATSPLLSTCCKCCKPRSHPGAEASQDFLRGSVSFWYSSGDTADINIHQASRTSGLTRTPSSPWLFVRACVRACGSVVGPP